MSRAIAVLTAMGYRMAYVSYDHEDLKNILSQRYAGDFSAHSLVNNGDMLVLRESSPMRTHNRMPATTHATLESVIKTAQAANVHHFSIHDTSGRTMDAIAAWNEECCEGVENEELYVENFMSQSPWRHILDGQSAFEAFASSKAA